MEKLFFYSSSELSGTCKFLGELLHFLCSGHKLSLLYKTVYLRRWFFGASCLSWTFVSSLSPRYFGFLKVFTDQVQKGGWTEVKAIRTQNVRDSFEKRAPGLNYLDGKYSRIKTHARACVCCDSELLKFSKHWPLKWKARISCRNSVTDFK